MELDIRGFPESDRQKCLNRWQCYKAELGRLESQFKQSKLEAEQSQSRDQLFAGSLSKDEEDSYHVNQDQKQRWGVKFRFTCLQTNFSIVHMYLFDLSKFIWSQDKKVQTYNIMYKSS